MMTEIEIAVARHEERISQITRCIGTQNERMEKIEDKLGRIYILLIGVMGGVIATLIVLVLDR